MTDINMEPASDSIEIPGTLDRNWLLGFWFHSRKTFKEIIHADGKTWWLPLGLLSVLQLVKSLIEISIRKTTAMTVSPAISEGMQKIPPEQQAQIQQSTSYQSGIFFTFVLPLIAGLASIWLVWVILSSILHLSLTLTGSRSNANTSFNLTAWAALPIGIRLVIQTFAVLISQQLIISTGLSGFITIQGRLTLMVSSILSFIDIYLIWQIIYLMVGVVQIGGVSAKKAIIAVLVSSIITLLLCAIPGFLSGLLSGMSINRPFFF